MSPTINSDSEDDFDYVPPADDNDSDGSDDHTETGTTAVTAVPVTPLIEQKKQRDALWASFQASVSTPPSSENSPPPPAKRVKIEKTYLFAGKHVTQVVEVREDSEDAKKWPRWSPRPPSSAAASAITSSGKEWENKAAVDKSEDHEPTPLPATPGPALTTTVTFTPGAKRPGPRKPRTSLPSIPDKASQAKKITTLDKSAMDWQAHVASQASDLKDELDANRRGGGYLEKVAFLKRVEDRREDAFGASKASKRRKT